MSHGITKEALNDLMRSLEQQNPPQHTLQVSGAHFQRLLASGATIPHPILKGTYMVREGQN